MEDISESSRLAVQNPSAIQLYSAATPNGVKIACICEELQDLRERKGDFLYEAHTVNIRHHESHHPDFLKLNPNGKIPVIVDPHGPTGQPISVFESGAILLYLSQKYGELIPSDAKLRVETMEWLFWGSTSISNQIKLFGFYYRYCQHPLKYCINRYKQEVSRLLGVLESKLSCYAHDEHWIIGDMYTIADVCIWPWIYALHENYGDAVTAEFDSLKEYPRVKAWYGRCLRRPASQRALDVTRFME